MAEQEQRRVFIPKDRMKTLIEDFTRAWLGRYPQEHVSTGVVVGDTFHPSDDFSHPDLYVAATLDGRRVFIGVAHLSVTGSTPVNLHTEEQWKALAQHLFDAALFGLNKNLN